MEEKERYYYDGLGEDIYDSEIDDYPSNKTICDTLNQQEKRIKELKNSEDNFCKCVSRLQKENKELQKQLEESKKMNKRLYNEKESAEKILRMSSNEQTKEISELQQQLKQTQKQLAIDELKKVKNRIKSKVKNIDKRLDDLKIKIVCESTSNQINTYQEIIEIINNKIKELKGEHK